MVRDTDIRIHFLIEFLEIIYYNVITNLIISVVIIYLLIL